jgi:TRAP-type C4-dicarboxylate transport system substrate-binding protein
VDLFKIYEVVKYVSMTNHMWSGFNMLANLAVWKTLPADIRTIIERNVAAAVRLQRRDQQEMNTSIRASLVQRGLVFNEVEAGPFRKQLSSFYARWKERLGTKCWGLLEESTKA